MLCSGAAAAAAAERRGWQGSFCELDQLLSRNQSTDRRCWGETEWWEGSGQALKAIFTEVQQDLVNGAATPYNSEIRSSFSIFAIKYGL